MDNYLLFKQAVSLILFLEALAVWPKFHIYFGPRVFPKSVFTTPFRISAFQVVLLTSLILLFLDCYSFIASVFLFLCMRYLFATETYSRISTFGAVGQICYVTAAYILLFEAAYFIDPSHQLAGLLHTVLAIEVGIIMVSAGVHKCISGYLHGSGLEYALVNPSWGKFFFIFKQLKPSSWVFKINNFGAIISELLAGLSFFLPQTRIFGAYLLVVIFFYSFLTVRVNILGLLMMSIALLYVQPIPFHFPILGLHFPQYAISQPIITLISAMIILYLAIFMMISLFRLLMAIIKIPAPPFLAKLSQIFMKVRPGFDWNVFTYGFTDYFVRINKASKATKAITAKLYDGFSKNYREVMEDPEMFFRFIHHHESSLVISIFTPMRFSQIKTQDSANEFVRKMVMYAATFLSESELEGTSVAFEVVQIEKKKDTFSCIPVAMFFVDVKTASVFMVR